MKKLPKRITLTGLGLATAAGFGALGVGATSAEFSSAQVSPNYALTNGTVNLTGAGATGPSWVGTLEGNLAPGDTTNHTYNLSYNGSLNAWVGLDTLMVSTIDTAGAPAAGSLANWGKAPQDYMYQVVAKAGGNKWAGALLSSNYTSIDAPTELASCPTTFDGQTVPTSLSVVNPGTGITSTVSKLFCYESPRTVIAYQNSDGTPASALTETISGGGTQTEKGAWPAGNSTASTLPVTVSLGLCNNSVTDALNPTPYVTTPWAAACDTAVPNLYQGQAEDVLVGATAVAARNNTNATNDGPTGFVDGYVATPGAGSANWG